MFSPDAILALLDSRSYGTVWFWLMLMLAWAGAGRRILGVPWDVVAGLRQATGGGEAEALALLDWLSLTLPRWRLGPRDGALLLGAGSFLMTVLLILGFGYGLEMAQALVLLLAPLALLFVLDLRLARRLRAVLARAEVGQPVAEAGAEAARLMTRHRMVILMLSILSALVTGFFAALWMILHPYGY